MNELVQFADALDQSLPGFNLLLFLTLAEPVAPIAAYLSGHQLQQTKGQVGEVVRPFLSHATTYDAVDFLPHDYRCSHKTEGRQRVGLRQVPGAARRPFNV